MNIKEPGPHLDHMLRQTRQHHVQLSSMADLKANILMTIASVVITLSIHQTMDPDLRWTALILILFSLITILLAAYSVMPKIPFRLREKIPREELDFPFNLHFFGDFTQMKYNDYVTSMESLMNNPSEAYESMVREIYTLGEYLAKEKYRYIRLAYISFIAGLILSGVTLLITGLF